MTRDWKADNQRLSSRVPYAARMLVVRDQQAWFTELQDMSVGGCGIFRPGECDLAVGQAIRLYFFEHPGPAIGVDARVVWVEERSLGFAYQTVQTVPPTAD